MSLLARHAMMTEIHVMTTTVPWLTLGAIAAACLGLAITAAIVPATHVLRDANPATATIE
jgi:hypothetical protein